MKVTMLFPGQGSQKVGMGADLDEKFPVAHSVFQKAAEVLGRDIAALCFRGPEDDLKQTQNTQPCLFTIEAAIVAILANKGITPAFTAGHSLGEYSALHAAGVFSFSDGLRLVARRGELMAKAGTVKPGTMAAVMGLTVAQIQGVLAALNAGTVVTANQNTPDQTVISGEVDAVNNACDALKGAGAKRAILLPVSGAFHSPLMQDAADEFALFLESITFSAPRCPVITNVTANSESDPATLKQLLVRQLISPVRWVESVTALAGLDHGTLLETGPGNVLAGLVKKCNASLDVVPCATAENIYSLAS